MYACVRVTVYHYMSSPIASSTDSCNTGCLNSWLGDRYCDAVSGQYWLHKEGEGGGEKGGEEGGGDGAWR